MTKTASYSRKKYLLLLVIALYAVVVLLLRHAFRTINGDVTEAVWFAMFIIFSWATMTALLAKPFVAPSEAASALDRLNVCVLVPVYNEDRKLLAKCILSIIRQTRRPQSIRIVDDGSNVPYENLNGISEYAARHSILLSFERTENRGKRHAQARGIRADDKADIFVTVDSDTILDPMAIEQGMLPFSDSRVNSVAGLVLAANNQHNLLTRFTGVWEVTWQLLDRASQSLFNSVAVNSGPLAFYRANILRQYLAPYLNETFFGKQVMFSDDSLLTLYSLNHGKTVQQPTAIAFSATPEKISHNIRRYLRWMRGSFIRSMWRIKYLPLGSYAFLLQALRWVQLALSLTMLTAVYVSAGIEYIAPLTLYIMAITIILSYTQALVSFSVKRSDQTFLSALLDYLVSPLAYIWLNTVLRVVRLYGYITCYKTGWGTRSKVETTSN